MKKNNFERNYRMIEKILLGRSCQSVAQEYELSAARVSHILHLYCMEKNGALYWQLKENPENGDLLPQLRKRVDAFLTEHEYLVTLNSPLYTIKELPKKLINTLKRIQILTVDDLLDLDAKSIKQMFGKAKASQAAIHLFREKYQSFDEGIKHRYSSAFKLKSASMVLDKDYDLDDLSQETGIKSGTLNRWVFQLRLEREGLITSGRNKAFMPENQKIQQLTKKVEALEKKLNHLRMKQVSE